MRIPKEDIRVTLDFLCDYMKLDETSKKLFREGVKDPTLLNKFDKLIERMKTEEELLKWFTKLVKIYMTGEGIKVDDLNKDELKQLKTIYFQRIKHPELTKSIEPLDVSTLVSDEEVIHYFKGLTFTADFLYLEYPDSPEDPCQPGKYRTADEVIMMFLNKVSM